MTVSLTQNDAGSRSSSPDQALDQSDSDGTARLLQDPSFRLIKVVHSEDPDIQWPPFTIESLTVVTPASNPDIAQDVNDRGWYVLSHMWGPPSTWIDWDDTGVVDEVTGEVLPVKVSSNKREEMMGLLRMFEGYWWIDVFCARSDTPLVIMGDIYKNSTTCYALVDSSPEVFCTGSYDIFNIAVDMLGENIDAAARAYTDSLIRQHASSEQQQQQQPEQREWKHTLKDVMRWSLEHYDDAIYTHLQKFVEIYWDIESLEPLLDRMKHHSADDMADIARTFFQHQDDDDNSMEVLNKPDQKLLLDLLGVWRMDNFSNALDGIAGVLDCRWMGRVWTLQELAMPLYILVTSSAATGSQGKRNIPESYLLQLQEDLGKIMQVVLRAYEMRRAIVPSSPETEDDSKLQAPLRLLEVHRKSDTVLACIYTDYRKLFEMVASIGRMHGSQANMENSNRNESLKLYLNSFATSQRKALYPADYVYGVLGILDIDIPPMDDIQKIWQMFSEKLRKRHPDIDIPEDIDLLKATKMEDVYGHFGFPYKENFVSPDVILNRVRFYE